MVFWVMESFPPVINIRPTVSMSRANMFSDGETFVHVGQCQLRKDKQISVFIFFQFTGLDHNVYKAGQDIQVSVKIDSNPSRRISKIIVQAIQAVDVAMFTSGAFKNDVSAEEEKVGLVETYQKTFTLSPCYTPGKHWVAVADSSRDHKSKNNQLR